MQNPPKPILLLSAILGMLVIASSALRIAQAAGATPINVYSIGFEAIAVVAGVFAILLARGRFTEGTGLTLASVAGVVIVASAVSYSTARAVPLYSASMLRDPFTAARFAVAGAFGVLAAATVLLRRPGVSFRRLFIGAVLTGAALALAAPVILPQAQSFVAGLHPMLRMMGAILGFVLFCGLFSAGLHFLIRAFEAGELTEHTNATLPADQPRNCAACGYPAAPGRNTCPECGANLLVLGSVTPQNIARPRATAVTGAA